MTVPREAAAAASAADESSAGPRVGQTAGGRRRWWTPRASRIAFTLFLLLVVAMLALNARRVDWNAVGQSLRAYPAVTLAGASALVALSYLVYASYDLVGRRYVRHRVRALRVLAVAFISYAFNLNLGSLIGGFGFRLGLYARLGLRVGTIGRLIGFSLVTNWSGYTLLLGAMLAARQLEPPLQSTLGQDALQLLGFALLLVSPAYVALCAFAKRRDYTLRGHAFTLPSVGMALAQVAVSALNWALIGAILNLLLPAELAYTTVLATLLASAILAAFTHIPGGIGVLEAIFVLVLGARVPAAQLIAALLVYRALYYWAPLAVAAALHFALAARTRPAERGSTEAHPSAGARASHDHRPAAQPSTRALHR